MLSYLVQGLLVEQTVEGLLVSVDQIKVRPVVQQGLDDGGLGRLVEGGRVQGRVALAVLGVGVGPALEEEGDGGYRGEDTDGVAAHRGGVSGTGQVEGRAPAPALGAHRDKLVHCLLHLEHLRRSECYASFHAMLIEVK